MTKHGKEGWRYHIVKHLGHRTDNTLSCWWCLLLKEAYSTRHMGTRLSRNWNISQCNPLAQILDLMLHSGLVSCPDFVPNEDKLTPETKPIVDC